MKACKMELRMVALAVALALVISPAVLAGSQKVSQGKKPLAELKLKVFEGVREGRVEPVKTVTSSFLRYTLSASIKSEDTSEREENQLRRVFNLRSVQLLTEANLSWPEIRSKDFHMFRLDSKEYAIVMTLVRVNSPERITCRLEVMEQDKDRKSNLLDSELALDRNVITTFGFEDSSGKPYFLSLKVQKIWAAGGPVVQPVEGVVGGVAGGVVAPKPTEPVPPEKAAETAKGLMALEAIRATGEIKPPRLIKKVDPVYPEEAREAGVEGVVILEVTTDKLGKVAAVRVLRSVPLLDQAAIDAVKQWVYEPYVVDGEARPIVFTVTVAFKLH
jgi:TonB family protein